MGQDLTDNQLIARVSASDEEAFRLLFERFQPMVFRHVLFQTRDADFAHDVVQETFLRVWHRRALLQPHLSFPAYVLRISANLVRDSIRRRETRTRLEDSVPVPRPSEGDDPAEAVSRAMLEDRIALIVATRLTPKCRAVFLLSRIEEKSNREIADTLGLSVRTVENQINRALKVLRRNLTGYL